MQAMTDEFTVAMTEEDWLNLGKADAWAGQPKRSPQQDPLADSLYDLGYSEGLSHCGRSLGKLPSVTSPAQIANGNG